MPLISEVLRAVQQFEQASFQLDEFDLEGGARVTAFFNNYTTARRVQQFLNNAQESLPKHLLCSIGQSGLQVYLLQREGVHSKKINPRFVQQLRKAIDAFKAFLLSPWEKSPSSVPGKVCYSKGGILIDLCRNLQPNIEIVCKITRDKDGFSVPTTDSIIGKEEHIIAFFQKLREEMEISSPEEEKKEDSPVEEGFTILRCAADIAPFRGKGVAYKTRSSNQLLFGKISPNPTKCVGIIGFQLRKACKEFPWFALLSNSYFNEPIFMREATEQEIAEHSLKED